MNHALMMAPELVYQYPTWVSAVAIVVITVLGSVAMQVVLHAVTPVAFRALHNVSITAIFSVIGVTYAVLLAFVATLAWEGFNKARAATFDEAGAIAELRRLTWEIPGTTGNALRSALTDYVRVVIDIEWPAQQRGHADNSGERQLDDLHGLVLRMDAQAPMLANVQGQFLSQLGMLSAARQGRLLATSPTVPQIVWVTILLGGALMIAFSALLGARSYALHLIMTASLAASGALVIVLIASLDSPFRSDFSISPTAYLMQNEMQ